MRGWETTWLSVKDDNRNSTSGRKVIDVKAAFCLIREKYLLGMALSKIEEHLPERCARAAPELEYFVQVRVRTKSHRVEPQRKTTQQCHFQRGLWNFKVQGTPGGRGDGQDFALSLEGQSV
jgi:hypothetical protein